ncbi:hypothetical protein J6590_059364 [Homalodisca vitripennis]|nr:hypothetical protein J6590_059364 [Homalodisca vitripennis]
MICEKILQHLIFGPGPERVKLEGFYKKKLTCLQPVPVDLNKQSYQKHHHHSVSHHLRDSPISPLQQLVDALSVVGGKDEFAAAVASPPLAPSEQDHLFQYTCLPHISRLKE